MNQTGVALKHIAVYLEEVTNQVLTLKKDYSQPHLPGAEDDDLRLENATLKWNEVAEDIDKDTDKGNRTMVLLQNQVRQTKPVQPSETVHPRGAPKALMGNGNRERVFELRDISVRFPPGELTVVTGPTASGKTALV